MKVGNHGKLKKCLALCMAGSMALTVTGCNNSKKEPKPEPKTTAKIDKGNANALGRGDGQADVPLIVGTDTFSKVFNPFSAETEPDRQVVDLTQVKLVTNDRAGKIIYHGIDGELRNYQGEDYTYYGASDLVIRYDKEKDSTIYNIKLREDLSFSDGQKLTIDDVLFSLYVFCDNSYAGAESIKYMPIKGLLNYQANSTKAESFTEKGLAKLIKKHRKKYYKWLRAQGYDALAAQISGKKISERAIIKKSKYNQELFRQARIYFSKGKGKKADSIAGIRKLGEYELSIETKGYQRRMSAALQIPICALHYYGDMAKFKPEAGRFGIRRGDISNVLANKSTPMGAGAYRFVKYEDGTVYFTSNELYFLGCPKIAFLHMKEMTDILAETRRNLAQKVAASTGSQGEEQGADVTPSPEVNPSAEVTELKGETVDILGGVFRGEELNWIASANSNQELEGSSLVSRFISDGVYRYLGIHGKNVSVGGQAGSEASKSLRRAMAVIFSSARSSLKERDGVSVDIVSHPMGKESWVVPENEEEDVEYQNIFEKDASGNALYDTEEKTGKRLEAAKKEALKALEQAGYTIENDRVVKAPQGASVSYRIWIANGEENPFYDMVVQAGQAFEEIGMQLHIESISNADELRKRLAGGSQQLWIGMRAVDDVDILGRYASYGGFQMDLSSNSTSRQGSYITADGNNIFGINDDKLDADLEVLQTYLTSAQRSRLYQKTMDKVLEWAVEVPLCEYQDALLFSSSKIKKDSIPQNLTPYYGWMNDVHRIEMK